MAENQTQTRPGAEGSHPRLAQQKGEPGAPGTGPCGLEIVDSRPFAAAVKRMPASGEYVLTKFNRDLAHSRGDGCTLRYAIWNQGGADCGYF